MLNIIRKNPDLSRGRKKENSIFISEPEMFQQEKSESSGRLRAVMPCPDGSRSKRTAAIGKQVCRYRDELDFSILPACLTLNSRSVSSKN